uniref:Uncharacterized protein n=1 Tax=Knipowitschia caucasica TaxID=637954 RepID=A0AAV2MJ35_KNICA
MLSAWPSVQSEIPTIKDANGEPRSSTSEEAPSHSRAGATAGKLRTRTVSTQISARTLKLQHVRSKGTLAKPNTKDASTETDQSWMVLSSTPIRSSTSGLGIGSRKRRRTDIFEEDEEDPDISDISPPQPHDSTYELGATLTDVSGMMETECPSAYEEPKYIVFDSNLKAMR